MSFWEAVQSALGSLASHKLRSALSMLGMIFGVGAVIAMLSIGAGGEHEAMQMIDRLGVDNVLVRAKKLDPDRREEVRQNSLGVSRRDGEAVTEALDAVELALPRIEVKTWKILGAGAKTEAEVFGVPPEAARVAGLGVAEGRFIDRRDERHHAQVGVIGATVRRDLFGYEPAVGRHLKINDVWIEVIGVLPEPVSLKGEFEGVSLASTAEQIFIPLSTASRKFDRDPLEAPLDELVLKVAEGHSPTVVAELVRPLLTRLHGGEDDFELVVPAALLEQSRQTQRLFNVVMGSIAGISLLVGGIGIMNIMLASVLERVREIGVRRALGARRRDIRTQFVIESFSISTLGGVLGILIGVALARGVATYADWPTVITVWSLVVSTGVSIAVGLISGFYPAARAASLDPVEALRWE